MLLWLSVEACCLSVLRLGLVVSCLQFRLMLFLRRRLSGVTAVRVQPVAQLFTKYVIRS